MVEWHYKSPIGNRHYDINGELTIQNIVMELKVLRKNDKYETLRDEAIEQTLNYTKRCGEDKAHILIFDRENKQGWTADEENEIVEIEGVVLEIWKLWQEREL
jgi:hypothetical protein